MYFCAEISFGSLQKQKNIGEKQVILVTFFFGYAGSSLLMGFLLVVASEGYSPLVLCRLLIVVASPVAEHRLQCARTSAVVAPGLQHTSSPVVAHGLQFSVASEIFPDQGSNLSLLHWQTDSLPLSHQESPSHKFYGNNPISAVLGVKQQ